MGADDIYKPTLWYFDLLHFLNDQDSARPSISTLSDADEETQEHLLSRVWNGPTTTSGSVTEKKVKDILQHRFPQAKTIDVVDISGGCGAMFEIVIEAQEFKGLSTVKQHRLINEALKEEIKDMHGLRIHTSVPL